MHKPRNSSCTSLVRKGRRTRYQIANILWIIENPREFTKISTSASLTTLKPLTLWITINCKILKEMGIWDHLTWLLTSLYAGQEANSYKWTWENELVRNWERSSRLNIVTLLFNFYAECIMQNGGLDESQARIKIAGRNIIFIYADDTTVMAESKEELKYLLMKVKEESEKTDLKLNIQKTKIMASGPIISWQTGGEPMKTVTYFIFFGSKITADGDCSHEIKSHLLLWRKAMTNLDSILKSRATTLPTKVHSKSKPWFFQWSCMDVRVAP